MASTYKTPGVYIEEISKFPPSVAQVETAIPAFIGYTEKALKENDPQALVGVPTRIKSLEEFREKFGGAPKPVSLTVTGAMVDDVFVPNAVALQIDYKLFNSLELFFANGGGPCYIVSVGLYASPVTISKATLKSGVDALQKYDEPTLIAVPDAVSLSAGSDHGALMADALSQCNLLKDRFTIMDVFDGDEASVSGSDSKTIADTFRGNVSSSYLKYGAAYFPFLKSFLSLNFNHEDITFMNGDTATEISDLTLLDDSAATGANFDVIVNGLTASKDQRDAVSGAAGVSAFKKSYADALALADPKNKLKNVGKAIKDAAAGLIEILDPDATIPIPDTTALHDTITGYTEAGKEAEAIVEQLLTYDVTYPTAGGLTIFNVIAGETDPPVSDDKPAGFTTPTYNYVWETTFNGTEYTGASNYQLYAIDTESLTENIYEGAANDTQRFTKGKPYFDALYERMLNLLEVIETSAQDAVADEEDKLKSTTVYQRVLTKINNTPLEMPPSGAVAGIYARVDKTRGVWKAPANVVVSNILGPSVKIDDKDQEDLNVDPTSGKSVNAIRAFTGKGTLVWGARTLAGNDNEWRYVPVRRFFNMVEESVKKSTAWAVFEPNDANLWVKVKAMIENYLTTLWRQGALAGSTADQAFYVKVGLDETMTSLDILEGRMIVEIGMAAVRPAEFIILKFSHKMQEA